MANFIELKKTYSPLTTEGERRKFINIDQIVYIEPLAEKTNNENRIQGLKSRICLSTGELLDIKEDFNELMAKMRE